MQSYLALLRGINVGGNSKVEMVKLKTVFESLGYSNVSTYINSGNVIFDGGDKSPNALAQEIEAALHRDFGFLIKVVVRDSKSITKLASEIPATWKNDTDLKTDILFLWDDFCNKETLDLIWQNTDVDKLKYVDGAIVWSIARRDYSKSGMRKFIGTTVYKNMTARNVNTVCKLVILLK